MLKRQNNNTTILLICLSLLLLFISCSSRESAVKPTYAISGTIDENMDGLAGVTVALTGTANASTTTDSNGNFSFSGLANGTYTVTPSLGYYTFDPVSKEVVIDDDDVSGTDFTAVAPAGPNLISGQVTGVGSNRVTISLSGTANKATSTDTSGNYSFTGLADGNYKVTPSLTDYGFNPVNIDVTISGASQTGKDFTATLIPTSTYTQADLTGRWKFQTLSTHTSPEWMRVVVSVNASGELTCESYEDSDATTNCPDSFDMKWTIDEDGKISESGTFGNSSAHMTMAWNKNFIAGIGSLRIGQKISTTFDGTELNDKSFVYHKLKTGAINEWRYGSGIIDSGGTMNVTSETASSGSVITPEFSGTLSVDSNGVVVLSGHDSFKGFLSNDNKTVVATETDGTSYILTVIQITGKTYSEGSPPDSISNVHMVASGASPLYAYWTATTFNGTMSSSNYVVSNGSFPAPGPSHPSVDANGVITISGDTYHGQLSDDGKFTVGTKTLNDTTPSGYALIVNTIK